MTIPCATCGMRSGCMQDGHCRRPLGTAAAVQECKEAIAAMNAATARLRTALQALEASAAIDLAMAKPPKP